MPPEIIYLIDVINIFLKDRICTFHTINDDIRKFKHSHVVVAIAAPIAPYTGIKIAFNVIFKITENKVLIKQYFSLPITIKIGYKKISSNQAITNLIDIIYSNIGTSA